LKTFPRRLERAMDRSRRATNPACFNDDGTWKKGANARDRSRRHQALALKRRERDAAWWPNASAATASLPTVLPTACSRVTAMRRPVSAASAGIHGSEPLGSVWIT
jgi:hypothetical protein